MAGEEEEADHQDRQIGHFDSEYDSPTRLLESEDSSAIVAVAVVAAAAAAAVVATRWSVVEI